VGQKDNFYLLKAIHILFNFNRKFEKIESANYFYIVRASSKKDIQNVISFFSSSNNFSLIGYRLIQYNQ
jgi:hypothetical protein